MKRAAVPSILVAVVLVALGVIAEAQQPKKVPRIGFLSVTSSGQDPRLEAFRQGLREMGYVEGKNFTLEYRSAEGKFDRLPALAAEPIRLNVDVIVTQGTPAAAAAKNATSTIPIIVSGGTDPVATGLVSSLARPGGEYYGRNYHERGISG